MTKKATRKAHRSGTRQCPICERICSLVEHHIHGREIRRANEAFNISWICPTCHDEVHLGEIIIEGWYKTTSGRELVWRYKNEPPKLDEGAKPHLY